MNLVAFDRFGDVVAECVGAEDLRTDKLLCRAADRDHGGLFREQVRQ